MDNYSPDEGTIDQLYRDLLHFVDTLAENNEIQAIAGVMMAQALTIYRTVLSDEDYEDMVNVIFESRNNIKPFGFVTNQTLN